MRPTLITRLMAACVSGMILQFTFATHSSETARAAEPEWVLVTNVYFVSNSTPTADDCMDLEGFVQEHGGSIGQIWVSKSGLSFRYKLSENSGRHVFGFLITRDMGAKAEFSCRASVLTIRHERGTFVLVRLAGFDRGIQNRVERAFCGADKG